MGEPILIVSGTIQNKHNENTWIAMYAVGYDETGEEVGGTLDYSSIFGQILVNLENEETGGFIIHMNYAYNIYSIRIYANTYSYPPP